MAPPKPARVTLRPNGPWDLSLDGFEVLQVTFAYPIDIVAYGPEGVDVTIRFEGAFELVEPDGTRRELDASRNTWEELSVVLSLRHDHPQSVHVEEGAALTVTFGSGPEIHAGATPDYDSWQVSGDDYSLISMPGGGVAVFGGRRS